jgi:hypothetical protein
MDFTVTMMMDRVVVDAEIADQETADALIQVLERNKAGLPTRAQRVEAVKPVQETEPLRN